MGILDYEDETKCKKKINFVEPKTLIPEPNLQISLFKGLHISTIFIVSNIDCTV